jgi:hypothetical protein
VKTGLLHHALDDDGEYALRQKLFLVVHRPDYLTNGPDPPLTRVSSASLPSGDEENTALMPAA